MTLPEELKEAIRHLPSNQKDKLIFRLLKKDLNLANQLLFELVSTEPVEVRRDKIKVKLQRDIDGCAVRFYSTGYLNMEVRGMSGMITEHVNITKDKYGEAALNLWMINEVLEKSNEKILSESYSKAEKFCTSVITRTFKIMLLIKKLHEDYLIDFEDNMRRLGNNIGRNPYLMKCAIYNGLDVNWLIQVDIPNDIEAIHRKLRDRGYLR
ncbi:MAG: hypothetical protein QM751_06575 [Paludibacteraceae bacterium]